MDEVFKAIEGYEGLYEVSNLGNVRSLDRIDCRGNRLKGKILSPSIDKKGYFRVRLYNEGKGKMFFVHRLVAQEFIPNPEGLPVINHKDENPSNNVVFLKDDGSVDECRSNLEWCTVRYNNVYGTRNERATKNMVQTRINNGTYDPEMCGIWNRDKKEYARLHYWKNREKINERRRDRRRKKKQGKKKDNRPSEESLW